MKQAMNIGASMVALRIAMIETGKAMKRDMFDIVWWIQFCRSVKL